MSAASQVTQSPPVKQAATKVAETIVKKAAEKGVDINSFSAIWDQVNNVLINNPLGYALLPALIVLVFIFISAVLMLLRSFQNRSSNNDTSVAKVNGSGYQKTLLKVSNSAIDNNFSNLQKNNRLDVAGCTALADLVTSQILIDVAWVKEALKEKNLLSVKQQVEGSLDIHFDTSSVNQDIYRLFSTSDAVMTQGNFRNTMNTWLLKEVAEVLSWHVVDEKPSYSAATPRRSVRKRKVKQVN